MTLEKCFPKFQLFILSKLPSAPYLAPIFKKISLRAVLELICKQLCTLLTCIALHLLYPSPKHEQSGLIIKLYDV
jgi:hypothetical protein